MISNSDGDFMMLANSKITFVITYLAITKPVSLYWLILFHPIELKKNLEYIAGYRVINEVKC